MLSVLLLHRYLLYKCSPGLVKHSLCTFSNFTTRFKFTSRLIPARDSGLIHTITISRVFLIVVSGEQCARLKIWKTSFIWRTKTFFLRYCHENCHICNTFNTQFIVTLVTLCFDGIVRSSNRNEMMITWQLPWKLWVSLFCSWYRPQDMHTSNYLILLLQLLYIQTS